MSEDDTDRLHAAMAEATAHLGAITMDPARLRRAHRRHRLTEGGAVAGVLSVALAATAIAMHGGSAKTAASTALKPSETRTQTTPSPAVKPITPIDVSVYDSDDGSEGKATAAQLLSGTGAWQTNQYCQNHATYHGAEKSTGLVFDLGSTTRVGTVTVDIGTQGADLEVWAAGPHVAWPTELRPGQPPTGFARVASAAGTGTGTVFTLNDVTTRYIMVWFAGALPALPNPDLTIMCAHNDGKRYGDSITAVKFTQG